MPCCATVTRAPCQQRQSYTHIQRVAKMGQHELLCKNVDKLPQSAVIMQISSTSYYSQIS